MISFDRREALRYMGYHGAEPDAAVAESLERCAAELQTACAAEKHLRTLPAVLHRGEYDADRRPHRHKRESRAQPQGLHGSIPDGGDARHRLQIG